MQTKKKNVLILCTGNSARSIMAEFLINHELGNDWQAFSAGVEPGSPKPYALKVIEEIGIQTKDARSKSVVEFLNREDLDLVITVCDHAKETCPVFMKPVEQIHIGIEDPSDFLHETEEIAVEKFREAREDIREEVLGYLKNLSGSQGS